MLALDYETTVSLRGPRAVVPPRLADFEIGRYLGGGGMGIVFEGRHITLGRRVALKFLHHETGEARARLVREAQAMARLHHPNVVSLFELGTTNEMFIAMELVEGGTLRDWLRQRHNWHDILDMFITIGRGIASVHAHGIVHRDINPSNVFLERDGTPKLGDFGLALTLDELDDEPMEPSPVITTRITSPGSVLGTPGYMPPEQIRGRPVDARSDQFAFCASLHEALEAGGLTRSLREILARGLEPTPEARFPSMTVLLAALVRARGTRGRRWSLCPARANATTLPY